MYKMIKRQPEAVSYAIQNCVKQASTVARLLENKRVYITGCGSSFHAALYGEYVLRANGFDAHAIHAMDMLHYTPDLKNSVAVVVSHSWKTRTTLKALHLLRKRKVTCIGITANKTAKESKISMRTGKEFDESDCVTMGYTTELVVLALIARAEDKDLNNIPTLINDALNTEKQIRNLVDAYSTKKRFFVLGAGPNTATAYEAALKMKEGNFTNTEGMQLEQMLHGSISGIDANDVVFLIAPKTSRVYERIVDTAQALKEIGVPTIAVTDSNDIVKICKDTIKIPQCSEYINPIVSIIPLQLFAYHFAVTNGINPDLTREDDIRYRNAYATLRLHLK
jgi:glucosamine 6-phosphate synthetase-like amidotransferase/phosphosugar isomerase protein